MFFNLFKNDFMKFIPKTNNVLLVETNGCHGEVIGGYIKYFQDLGINTYVLVSKTIKKENPFARLNPDKLFYAKTKEFSKLLVSKYLNRYDHIIVCSSYNYTYHKPIIDAHPDLQKHPSVYYVHHNQSFIHDYYSNIPESHNIMLGKIVDKTGGGTSIYINPHLFGDYSVPKKSNETNFISVGGINPKRKNHTLLLDAIKKLHNQGYKFHVFIVGDGLLKHIDNDVKQHLTLLGHLNYDKMYDAVESAHFFLPLLDDKNPEHDRYIKTQVTGSAQLIYGFRKIPVIHKKFAKFYKFDDKNAVIYDDLASGMEKAILTTSKDYDKYIKHLDKTANDIKQESLNNLKDILNA